MNTYAKIVKIQFITYPARLSDYYYYHYYDRLRHWISRTPSPTVLMMLPGGCVPTGSS